MIIQLINGILKRMEKLNKSYRLMIGFVLIVIIGLVDFVTGYELAFSVFYVLPIAIVTWYTDQKLGLLVSIICALVWLAADIGAGHPYIIPFVPVWNTVIRLAFFVIITVLLSALRCSTEREKELARIDFLTGAVNSRYFYELVQNEVDRIQRYGHPFTIAYIDLDNFKNVNDQFGHSVGDQVLRSVASTARNHLRKTDVVARLGGDEFALLLPETDEESAHSALAKIQADLLEEMHRRNLQVTFSIGVLTSTCAPHATDELIKIADELMYSVKCDGKNATKYSVYTG